MSAEYEYTLAHNLREKYGEKYAHQRLIDHKVWFLHGFARNKQAAKEVASVLRAGKWRPDNKSTVWRVRVVPVTQGYLVYRR